MAQALNLFMQKFETLEINLSHIKYLARFNTQQLTLLNTRRVFRSQDLLGKETQSLPYKRPESS